MALSHENPMMRCSDVAITGYVINMPYMDGNSAMHYALSLQAIGELSWQTWCCKPGADFLLFDSDP